MVVAVPRSRKRHKSSGGRLSTMLNRYDIDRLPVEWKWGAFFLPVVFCKLYVFVYYSRLS